MKVLVIGARGMLGRSLCRCLRGRGMNILEVDLPGFDITDIKKTVDYLRCVKPERIFHLAAFTDVDACERERDKAYSVNVLGTEAVVSGMRSLDAELIYMSTDYVFDGKKESPYCENDVPNPLNYYGVTKLSGEEIVRETLKRCFIVRTSGLYGKHGRNFVDTILRMSQDQNPLKVVSDQHCSPTYVKDLSIALLALASTGQYGIYHIVNSGVCSWYEFALRIKDLCNFNNQIVPIDSRELARPAKRPLFSALSNEHFESVTSHKMREWRDALGDYFRVAGKD